MSNIYMVHTSAPPTSKATILLSSTLTWGAPLLILGLDEPVTEESCRDIGIEGSAVVFAVESPPREIGDQNVG